MGKGDLPDMSALALGHTCYICYVTLPAYEKSLCNI